MPAGVLPGARRHTIPLTDQGTEGGRVPGVPLKGPIVVHRRQIFLPNEAPLWSGCWWGAFVTILSCSFPCPVTTYSLLLLPNDILWYLGVTYFRLLGPSCCPVATLATQVLHRSSTVADPAAHLLLLQLSGYWVVASTMKLLLLPLSCYLIPAPAANLFYELLTFYFVSAPTMEVLSSYCSCSCCSIPDQLFILAHNCCRVTAPTP